MKRSRRSIVLGRLVTHVEKSAQSTDRTLPTRLLRRYILDAQTLLETSKPDILESEFASFHSRLRAVSSSIADRKSRRIINIGNLIPVESIDPLVNSLPSPTISPQANMGFQMETEETETTTESEPDFEVLGLDFPSARSRSDPSASATGTDTGTAMDSLRLLDSMFPKEATTESVSASASASASRDSPTMRQKKKSKSVSFGIPVASSIRLSSHLARIRTQHARLRNLRAVGAVLVEEGEENEMQLRRHALAESSADREKDRIEEMTGDVARYAKRLKEKALDVDDAMDESRVIVEEGVKQMRDTGDEVRRGKERVLAHLRYLKANCCTMCGLLVMYFMIFFFSMVLIRVRPKGAPW